MQVFRSHPRPWSCLLLIAALALLGAVRAQAAVITACGPNVCYEYNDAQVAVALTGTPTLVGDDMQFLPPAFIAQATGIGGSMTTSAAFIFSRVYTVDPGHEILTFHTFEEFDYEIITDGQVGLSLNTQADSNLLPADTTSTSVNWSASGDSAGPQIDLANAYLFPAAAFSAAANDMKVTITNEISAMTDGLDEDAFIQKKFTLVALTTAPVPVPVPAAAWLFACALAALGGLRHAQR